MKSRKWAGRWAVLFAVGALLSAASVQADSAESTEYIDPARQEKWEQNQEIRAQKAENRRAFLNKWFGKAGKLKPSRQSHLDDQMAGGELK